jgi:hypothetical protein
MKSKVGGSIHPPQPNLLNRNGSLTRLSRPFLHLGKIWKRKQFSPLFFRPLGAEQHTKFFSSGPFMLREGVGVAFSHTVPAVPQALLANLLRDSQRLRGRQPGCSIAALARMQIDKSFLNHQ